MTLADIQFPVSYEWGCRHALVFSLPLARRLAELHNAVGQRDCVPSPVRLADGRMMLTADILTAVEPGGWLYQMWQAADKAALLPAVEVLPLQDAVALLPQAEET